MIKLLTISIIFLLLYLGFSVISQLDSQLNLTVYDYYLETTFFTASIFFLLLLIATSIIFKTIFLLLNLPNIIKNFFYNKIIAKKKEQESLYIIQAMAECIIGNKGKSHEIINKISKDLKPGNIEYYNLILAESATIIDQKIQHFQKIEQSKSFSLFALKRLAQIFYNSGDFIKAEDYASKLYNAKENDSENLEILLDCYAELSLWNRFTFILEKLAKIDRPLLLTIENKISIYFLKATKEMKAKNNEQAVYDYLELESKLYPHKLKMLKHL